MANNTTCDIWRVGGGSAASSGVGCLLAPSKQFDQNTGPFFTHIMYVSGSTDIRDDFFNAGFNNAGNADLVFVPDSSGTEFIVVLVRRVPFSGDKQVLLARVPGGAVSWPTSNL